MDSEEETEVKSFRNTNNNTNHSKENPATIFEEEENSELVNTGPGRSSDNGTRKLACSFLQKKEDILYEDDEDSEIENSDEEPLDESMERADLEFEFDGVEYGSPSFSCLKAYFNIFF